MKARTSLESPAAPGLYAPAIARRSWARGQLPHLTQTRRTDSSARVLAILLLLLVVSLALFSKAFRFGQDCGRTVGQAAPFGQAYEVCDWFTCQIAR
jgi:hypothetical protein